MHLKPSAAEGRGNTLFQRNLLFAYREIDAELARVVLQCFYEHASRSLSPINVSLSVFAEVPTYSVEAVAVSLFLRLLTLEVY